MTKNNLEAYFTRNMKVIIEREIWELVDTGRDNFKKSQMKKSPMIRLNIPVKQSSKLCMEKQE